MKLQEHFDELRDFAHPDYPGLRFTFYSKGDPNTPDFINWDEWSEGKVLVAEPAKTH